MLSLWLCGCGIIIIECFQQIQIFYTESVRFSWEKNIVLDRDQWSIPASKIHLKIWKTFSNRFTAGLYRVVVKMSVQNQICTEILYNWTASLLIWKWVYCSFKSQTSPSPPPPPPQNPTGSLQRPSVHLYLLSPSIFPPQYTERTGWLMNVWMFWNDKIFSHPSHHHTITITNYPDFGTN